MRGVWLFGQMKSTNRVGQMAEMHGRNVCIAAEGYNDECHGNFGRFNGVIPAELVIKRSS